MSRTNSPSLAQQFLARHTEPLAVLPSTQMVADRDVLMRTHKDMAQLFGHKCAVKINFVPQMVCQIALQQARQLCQVAKAENAKDIRKFTSAIKQAADQFERRNQGYLGSVFDMYQEQVRCYMERMGSRIFLCQLNLQEDARNDKQCRNHRIAACAAYTIVIVDYIAHFYSCVSSSLSEAMKSIVSIKMDKTLAVIANNCVDIGAAGYRFTPSARTNLWIRIFAIGADSMFKKLFDEQE